MGKSWVPLCMIMVVLGLAACQQSAAPTVVLTPAAEIIVQAPVATGARALEVLTPTPADAQQTAISATRLPPIDLTQMTGDSWFSISPDGNWTAQVQVAYPFDKNGVTTGDQYYVLSLIHISEPTRLLSISYAVFCLKKKKTANQQIIK